VAAVRALQARWPVVLVELSRNFGKEAALMAGLAHARGAAVIMLDADGQHPVPMMLEMLAHWRQGAEQVVAVQSERVNTTMAYKLSVRLFYQLINRGARFELPAHAGDFRLIDRKVVDTLLALPERTRFMKGLYAWAGFRTVLLPYQPEPRIAGRSQFTSSTLRRLALDGLTSFSDLPLRAMSWLGFGFAVFAVAMALWFVVEYYVVGVDVPGWTTVVVLVSLLSGIQLVCLGILGAYVSRIFQESKQRPLYVVRDVARPHERIAD
jgi:glycosyltransferase involved in cell wall biosynthesis